MRAIKPTFMAILVLFLTGIVPVKAAELVMVEQAGCHWCERWDEEIGVVYHKTTEAKRAPLRRVDIFDLPKDLTFDTRPQFTPTFVLFEQGVEIGRIQGYPSEDFFWPLLNRMLDKLPSSRTDGGQSLGN